MNGIDVSSYQPGNITGIVPLDFAIIKATEGIGYVSPNCDQQYQIAKAAGKGLGVYAFASGGDATAEADHFVNSIQGYLGEAILVIDYEANAIPRGREWLRVFVKRIVERTSVFPVVYASQSVVTGQQLDVLCAEENCGLWVANYGANNATGYIEADQLNGSIIRQYTSKGQLPGYGGNLDLNYAILTLDQWKKYALGKRDGSTATPVAPPAQPLKKSNDDIATEVMRGAWGNGDDRKARLTAAGYDPQAIQDIINGKYVRKSDDEVADEVIAGKWGVGDDRRARLAGQGYDADAIQAKVNAKLNAPAPAQTIEIVIPSGATLGAIASQYGTSVAQLLVWNKPRYATMTANFIQAGWTIRVR